MLLTFLLKEIWWHFGFHHISDGSAAAERRLFPFFLFFLSEKSAKQQQQQKKLSLKLQPELINKPRWRQSDKHLL